MGDPRNRRQRAIREFGTDQYIAKVRDTLTGDGHLEGAQLRDGWQAPRVESMDEFTSSAAEFFDLASIIFW